jgi:hypothetical protein
MISRVLSAAAVTLIALAVTSPPVGAQTSRAEIRTWGGQVYQVSDPSLELNYTIQVPPPQGGKGPSEGAATTGAKTPMLFGTAEAIGDFLDKQPEPIQAHRQRETITLQKDGAEIRLALNSVNSLFFSRQPVPTSLPPYAVSQQYRYSATAVLDDGSRIEGTYINLGTTFLRGRTPQGRVDIPWDQIEVVRFAR